VLRFFHRSTGQMPRVASWSPFAHNVGADCEAVAQALLAAVEHEECPLEELTPTRYSELRRKRPQMGLPRTTTVTSVCGSWRSAVEAAERRAAALTRRAAFAS
jgi:hypothetical protein